MSSEFTESCTILRSGFRTLLPPPRRTPAPLAVTPGSYLQPQAATLPLSVFTSFPFLDISCKRSHTACGLWRLAPFAQSAVFETRLSCSRRHCFLSTAEQPSIDRTRHQLSDHSSAGGSLRPVSVGAHTFTFLG